MRPMISLLLLCALTIGPSATCAQDIASNIHRGQSDISEVRGYNTYYAYDRDRDGNIVAITVAFTSEQSLERTPYHVPCQYGTDHCFKLETTPALYSTFSFVRNTAGALLGGTVTSTWNIDGDLFPRLIRQTIRAEQRNETTSRLTFIGYDMKLWTYPVAGYELQQLRGGKTLFRTCFWFERGVCKTTLPD